MSTRSQKLLVTGYRSKLIPQRITGNYRGNQGHNEQPKNRCNGVFIQALTAPALCLIPDQDKIKNRLTIANFGQ